VLCDLREPAALCCVCGVFALNKVCRLLKCCVSRFALPLTLSSEGFYFGAESGDCDAC